MAASKHGGLGSRDRLAKFVDNHPNEDEQHLARSALMWLSVAQRPLRARELWLALQVGQSEEAEHVERLLTDYRDIGEQQAARNLRNLLGNLVSLGDGLPSGECPGVSLRDPELRTALTHIRDDLKGARLSFSMPQANMSIATMCMRACSVTTLHLAHAHDDTAASSLILYAWQYWSTHLALSGHQLSDPDVAKHFDLMASRVCSNALVLLLGLNDYAIGPITVPATESYMACVAAIRDAQLAIELPGTALCELVQQDGYSLALQSTRETIELSRSTPVDESAPLRHSREPDSQKEVQSLDLSLRNTISLLDGTERQLISMFADTACGLRSVCAAFSRSPLHEVVLKESGSDWSTSDMLVSLADWMETVASYPFWGEIAKAHQSDTSHVIDRNVEDSRPITRSRGVRSSSPSIYNGKEQEIVRSETPKPEDVSYLRWHIAGIVYKLKSFRFNRVGMTIVINDPKFPSRRTSSFAAIPWYMHSDSLPFFPQHLAPGIIRQFHHRRISPLLQRLCVSDIFAPLDESACNISTCGLANTWSRTKVALLSDGYSIPLLQFGIAILLHHVRRMLIPWLGAWVYGDPLEDLRLARGNPEVFLDEALDFSWTWLAFMYAQRWAFDLLGLFLVRILELSNGRMPPYIITQARERNAGINSRLILERLLSIVKVGYLMWILASIEYMFDRSLSTFSFLLAYTKLSLLSPAGSANRTVFGLVLRKHWMKIPLNICQIALYVVYGIMPMMWGALKCAGAGRPGLLLMLATLGSGVWMVIRYRSRFFIALEMSSMFVVIGCAALLFTMLGLEFVDDPLGLKVSSARAQRTSYTIREALLHGSAVESIQISGGKLEPRATSHKRRASSKKG